MPDNTDSTDDKTPPAQTPGRLEACGTSPARLRDLAIFFLRLGTTAFGGPAAHIAIMEDELVVRRKWVDRQRFLDLLAAANLIPGPSSTELAIYIGYEKGGVGGLLLAGTCFILPAFLIVLAIAWAYMRYGYLPAVGSIVYGAVPVLIPILLFAAWRLGRSAIKTRSLAIVAVLAMGLAFCRDFVPDTWPEQWRMVSYPLVVLMVSGIAALMLKQAEQPPAAKSAAWLWPLLPFAAGSAGMLLVPLTLLGLFLVFLKIGALIFGSGYVLLPFLTEELVDHRGWLTKDMVSVAVTVGQVTPGPVFTTATFIGYVLAGWTGAIVATVAIFLPAFLLVGLTGPFVRRMREWKTASAFLDGLNVAAVALIVEISWTLGRPALIGIPTWIIACVSGLLLVRFKVNSSWLVLGGGLAGLLLCGW